MTARILDGKSLAATLKAEISERAARFTKETGATACLAAVLVGEDPASQVYVRSKQRECERAGMASQVHRLAADASQQELLDLVARLNADSAVHGILVQLPLPGHMQPTEVLDAIDPLKDVDAFHPENVGLLVQGRPRFLPCTPHGVLHLLARNKIQVSGRSAVVVGRSEIVGKPLSILLGQKNCHLGGDVVNATVTLCHSRTADLAAVTRSAEILIVAVGKPAAVTGEMIKPGAVVIDVGVNRTEAGLVGDVEFESARKVAGAITPVPGGVGPLTIAMVLENTLRAAEGLVNAAA